jgi:type I restriction enzyme S subunit
LGDVFEQTSNLVNPKEDEIELWSLTVEDGLTKKSDRYNREFLVKKDDNFKTMDDLLKSKPIKKRGVIK